MSFFERDHGSENLLPVLHRGLPYILKNVIRPLSFAVKVSSLQEEAALREDTDAGAAEEESDTEDGTSLSGVADAAVAR